MGGFLCLLKVGKKIDSSNDLWEFEVKKKKQNLTLSLSTIQMFFIHIYSYSPY